jgi:arylsulfatase A-like enzyme
VPILQDTAVVERPANQHTITRRYTDKAIDFIRAHQEKPFFLYLAHSLPHIPLYAGKDHLGQSRRGIYGDVIEEIDAGVGRILSALQELKLSENTLVVFTSDNGPWLPFETHGGSAGLLREGKGTTFEGGMRVPTLFWWPGQIRPGVQMELGATMDLLPTFSALSGAPLPQDRTLDGYNLAPLLLGQTTQSPRDRIFYWREEALYAVRVGPWKAHFITQGCYGIGPQKEEHAVPQLYHLENDPSEKYNVAAQHPEVIQRLQAVAESHRQNIQPVENQLAQR